MKLRDMMNPEGVVVKTATGYAYRYFMRDYLNSVRHVSGIEQLTDYDPLGAVISSVNLDKNSYLYESKERYADFSDAYDGVYDFGARLYNPLYGRWFALDPAKQGINPYIYCGNNPVMLVDPDGRWIEPTVYKLLMSYLKMFKSKYEDRNIELESEINSSNNSRKIKKLKKERSKNDAYISEFSELEDILTKMYDDKETFVFSKSDAPAKGIYRNKNNDIIIQYRTQGQAFHEVRHVGQGYDAGRLDFIEIGGVQWLANAGNKTGDPLQKTQNEIDAYKTQFVIDGPYGIESADGVIIWINTINDITPNNLYRIKQDNGNGGYVRPYDFAKRKSNDKTN